MKNVRAGSEMRLPPTIGSALEFAVCVTHNWVDKGKVYIDILDSDVFEVEEMFLPVYERRGWLEKEHLRGFDIEPENFGVIIDHFFASPKLARIIARKMAHNVLLGYHIPEGLRILAYHVLSGDVPFPSPKAVKPTLLHRDTLLVGLANRVSEQADIALGYGRAVLSSGDPKPICGATIAAAALFAHGVHLNVPQAAKIVYEKSHLHTDELPTRRIFGLASRSSVVNALVGLDPSNSIQHFEISDVKSEIEKAVKWLTSPI
jgi:hypothetical protein